MSAKTIDEGGAAFAIVATTQYILLVDLNTKHVIPLETHRPEYYGISWFPDSQELLLSHSGIDNAALCDISTYALSEVGFISQGEVVTPRFLSAPHQILCASDGRVVCTNTGRNAISVIDLAKPNCFQEARISAARWDRLSLDSATGDHLNSVFEKDGLLYVIGHGHKKGSFLATLSYPGLEVVSLEPVKGRTGLHNIWITDDGQRISCHSEAGALFDLSSDEILWDAGSPIYTRGLAASSEFVLVGESQKLGRDLRHSSMSSLWLLDRRTWKALDYFCLGPYGGVHEVRLLNVVDEAHHGHPFGNIAALQKHDLRSAMGKQRRESALQAQHNRDAWRGFSLVFGAPIDGDRGAKTADWANLCLLTQRAPLHFSERRFEFRYSLDYAPGKSHVSVVLYRGKGDDTDMHALLIQPVSEDQAHLSLWLHDGTGWGVQTGVEVGQLPLTGDIQVHANLTEIKLFLNGKMIVGVPLEKTLLHDGALGIRWLGATIFPSNGKSRGDV